MIAMRLLEFFLRNGLTLKIIMLSEIRRFCPKSLLKKGQCQDI
jgi:hypothetical protein